MKPYTSATTANRESSPVPLDRSSSPTPKQDYGSISGKVIRFSSPGKSPRRVSSQNPGLNGERDYRLPTTPLIAEHESHERMNGSSSPAETRRTSVSRLAPMTNGNSIRRVSGGLDSSPNGGTPRSRALSPPSENESQWSSAVGHATTAGKSGRVIERLMAENDRLKKELELQLLRSQELERSLQTMRPQLEVLRTENDNLNHANSMDEAVLARRDRKIEQLKEEVAAERKRREATEALSRKYERQNDDLQEKARREVQQAQEEAKHATTHATILEQSHKQLSTEYRQRAERFRKEVVELQTQRQSDNAKFARLEVVGEQMACELERARKLQGEYAERWEEYQTATEAWKESLGTVAEQENERTRKLSQDMETVTNKMKWVMNMERVKKGGQ